MSLSYSLLDLVGHVISRFVSHNMRNLVLVMLKDLQNCQEADQQQAAFSLLSKMPVK